MIDPDQLPVDQQQLYYTKKMYHDMHFFFRLQKIRFWIKTAIIIVVIALLSFGAFKVYQLVDQILQSNFVEDVRSLNRSVSDLKNRLESTDQAIDNAKETGIKGLLKNYLGNE